MPKVHGPAFSINAKGTIGKILTFQKRGHNVAAIRKPVPPNCQSPAQLNQRSLMINARKAWKRLSEFHKKYWNNLAIIQSGVSGYNLFVQSFIHSLTQSEKYHYNQTKYGHGAYK